MTYIESIFVPWFTQLTVVFFFVSGLIALAVGVGLIACTAWTLEFAASINRWAAAQSALRWVATERDVERPLQRHARVFGALLIAGGAFVLIAGPETRGFITKFALHPVNVDWIGTAVNRVLITGNVFAIVLGIVLSVLLIVKSMGVGRARRFNVIMPHRVLGSITLVGPVARFDAFRRDYLAGLITAAAQGITQRISETSEPRLDP